MRDWEVQDRGGIGPGLAVLAVVLAVAAALIWAVLHVADTPVVYESYNLRVCVWVDSPDPTHSCDNLPERYYRRWSH